MTNCYLCNTPLTDKNKSLEHIIPNALGGRLKAYILCKTCNSKMGETIDNKLVECFKFLNIQLDIKRDRNNTIQSIPIEIDKIKADLKTGNEIVSRFIPQNISDNNGKGVQFCGIFTNEKDEKVFFKNVQKYINAQSKDKQYTLGEIKALSKIEAKQPLIMNKTAFNFDDISLGYLKILLGFCALKDKIQYINHNIITFLKECDLEHIDKIATFCGNTKFLENGRLCHHIHIIGRQKENKLFGIVSLYGKFCCIFILNNNYKDKDFIESYSYDLLNNKTLDKSLDINNLNLTQYFCNQKELCLKEIQSIIVHCFDYCMQFLVVQPSDKMSLFILQLFEFIVATKAKCLNIKNLKHYTKWALLEARKHNTFLFLRDLEIDKIVNDIITEEIYLFYKQKYDNFQIVLKTLENEHSDIMKYLRSCMSEDDIRKNIAFSSILNINNIWVKILL